MTPDTLLLVILILILVALGFVVWQILKLSQEREVSRELLSQFQKTFDTNLKDVRSNLTQSQRAIGERLDKAAQVIAGVHKSLGEMTELGRSMKELQDFLRSPKLRGGLGEQILADLLGQMLPKKSFHLQYAFRGGQVVDAAIEIEKGIIPVDSKFPMENFRKIVSAESQAEKASAQKEFSRDVRKHIDDISKKYILPDEGTIEYALMYIPSEPVYYEVINSLDITEYAHEKHVLPVSPNSFYYFLKLIILGMEGQKLEERTRYILTMIRGLKVDSEKVDETLGTLTRHIKNASGSVDEVNTRYARLSGKISQANALPAEEKKKLKEPEEVIEEVEDRIFESKS